MKCLKFFGAVVSALVIGGGAATPADAQRLTPRSSPDSIRAALASGGTVTFAPGRYTLRNEIRVILQGRDLTVNARGARFVSDRIDGDMFRIITGPRSTTGRPNITWTGGFIDLRRQLLSTTRPLVQVDANSGRVGLRATADGLSIRGGDRLGRVIVQGLTVQGSNGNWRTAGGDSGIFIQGAADTRVLRCRLIGLRDAGVYVSDQPGGPPVRFTIMNNIAERCYDGFTAKRGAENVRIANNILVGNTVGVSLKPAGVDNLHVNARFTGNFITGSNRSVDLTNFRDGTFIANRIFVNRANRDFRVRNGDRTIGQLRRDNRVTQRLATTREIDAEKQRRGL